MKTFQPSNPKTEANRFLSAGAWGLLLVILLVPMVLEFNQAVPVARLASMITDPKWVMTLLALAAWAVLLVASLVLLLGDLGFPHSAEAPGRFRAAWITWRDRYKWLSWIIALAVALFPALFLLYSFWGEVFSGPYSRLLILLSSSAVMAAFMPVNYEKLISQRSLLIGAIFVAGLYGVAVQFATVVNYPFSITWSEGNRIFEYSIYFGKARYVYSGELEPIRVAIGRYMLWGLPFLIPEAPIWLHRLWNAILSTLPHLALGLSLARWSELPRLGKAAFAVWVFLFLGQGPIYTPLILSAILVVWLVHPRRWLLSLLAAAAAGFYASLSRWTWLPAVPVWSAFILLSDYQLPGPGISAFLRWENLRKLFWIALVSLCGLAAGALANPKLLLPKEFSQGTSFSQPLLWYRLFPNATYPEGVLAALFIATAPLLLWLIWLAATGRWPLNWVQRLAFIGATVIFLGGGLVVSVKIGGGNNLHNLDMFLVTLAILAGLAMRGKSLTDAASWPVAVRGLLVLTLLFPAWSALRLGGPLRLPSEEVVSKALSVLSKQVAQAQRSGEVLFMDQRQLLTFGYIQDVPLVNEYEKKFVMDQAMAGDQAYFEQFYRDLANQRFSLIITEPLFTRTKDSSYSFGEENNAWVHWVAEPLLCYYAPARKIQNVDIQLLVPRENPQDCP